MPTHDWTRDVEQLNQPNPPGTAVAVWLLLLLITLPVIALAVIR